MFLHEDVAKHFQIPIPLEEGWLLGSLFLRLVDQNQYRGQPTAQKVIKSILNLMKIFMSLTQTCNNDRSGDEDGRFPVAIVESRAWTTWWAFSLW